MTMSITKGHTRLIPCSLHSDCKNVQKSALKSVVPVFVPLSHFPKSVPLGTLFPFVSLQALILSLLRNKYIL